VDRVYDFALPPLILSAIFNHSARYLKQWLEISRNHHCVDTHDKWCTDIGADGRSGITWLICGIGCPVKDHEQYERVDGRPARLLILIYTRSITFVIART
jgi:hypothetical protein